MIEKDQKIEQLIKEIVSDTEKKFGKGAVVNLGTESKSDVKDWISTGSRVLDRVIGNGIPVGRITEIYGWEASGKSTLGMQILGNAQKQGSVAIMIDTETSYDAYRAKVLGMDTSKLIYAQMDSMEDCFDLIQNTAILVKNQNADAQVIILWDSVAATPTKSELEAAFGAKQYGPGAWVMSQAFRKIKRELTWKNITMVFVNQVRDNIGVQYGPKMVTYAGNALKFYASVRLELKVAQKLLDVNNHVTGVKLQVRTVKNKISVPYRECEVILDFVSGINDFETSMLYIVNTKTIDGNKGWYTYQSLNPEIIKASWRYDEIKDHLRTHPEEFKVLLDKALEDQMVSNINPEYDNNDNRNPEN